MKKKELKPKRPRSKRNAVNSDDLRHDFYQAIDAGHLTLRTGIRKFRKLLGLNQHEFAAFVGISPRVLMEFEQGKGNPTIATIAKMLKGSGLELKLGRKGSPNSLSTKVVI